MGLPLPERPRLKMSLDLIGPAVSPTELSPMVIWEESPSRPVIRDAEVHVWLAMTTWGPGGGRRLGVLSPEEVERAARFHFDRDRERFVRARAVLRTLLGRYLGADPAGLHFRLNEYGKPALAGEWEDSGISFNLSHSDEVVLYAFARGREVGVDVERVRPEFAGEDIAARFFAAPEVEALRRTPAEARAAAFFSCWTRKEAYVKARGGGLSLPLDGFAVSVDAAAREVALSVFGHAEVGERWTIIGLIPAAGYVAALAAEGDVRNLNFWRADI